MYDSSYAREFCHAEPRRLCKYLSGRLFLVMLILNLLHTILSPSTSFCCPEPIVFCQQGGRVSPAGEGQERIVPGSRVARPSWELCAVCQVSKQDD